VSASERKTIPRSAVTRLEWSRGQRRHPVAGLIVGAVLGGAALGVLGAGLCDAADCTGTTTKAALAGAALGGLSGAGIGALVKTRDWADVPVSSVQVSVAPVRGAGLALRITLRF
jgi:hypothetical protein